MDGRNIIEEVLNNSGLSLNAMSKLISYDSAAVSRVKNRERKMTYRMAYKIHNIFGNDLEDIIEVEGVV